MLSKNEMKILERFVKFVDKDEDYIKYNVCEHLMNIAKRLERNIYCLS